MKSFLLILSLFSFCLACKKIDSSVQQVSHAGLETLQQENTTENTIENDYWYKGKAEISRYELSQNRYKDNNPGEVIMIFVTEDFLVEKQVKNDSNKGFKSTSVLKNNMIRKFSTGVYDYSMMTSVFTPVQRDKFPQTLKITTSSQDWCGQTFQQLNWKGDHYLSDTRSYFESEGDKRQETKTPLTEDELFNLIRLDPASLPVGQLKIIPSTQISRLMHLELKGYSAELGKSKFNGAGFVGEDLMSYTIDYQNLNRFIEIVFEKEFPHKIIGWLDSYPSMFDKKIRTTVAKRTHTTYSAYWNENSLNDMDLRSNLGM